MNQDFRYYAKYLAGLTVVVLVAAFAREGLSITFRFRPIKPPASGGQLQSDEQQAIVAVRTAKASVVSLVSNVKVVEDEGQAERYVDNGYGTGFVVDQAGYIVTNSHVVSDKDARFFVVLPDGSRTEAKVMGVDRARDIALLKAEVKLPQVKLGNSDDLETGQTVFAIGNSLGRYQNTVSRGVVSGIGRDVNPGSADSPQPRLLNLIQTDAAINPGNSGGPLVNMVGEVVGMNTLIDTGGTSLGFAVPVNDIKQAVSDIRSGGSALRPYMGISYQTIDTNLRAAKRYGPEVQGALVLSVVAGSPAAASGLKVGDIVTSVDWEKLSEASELDKVVSRYRAGNQIFLGLERDGQHLDLVLILGEYK